MHEKRILKLPAVLLLLFFKPNIKNVLVVMTYFFSLSTDQYALQAGFGCYWLLVWQAGPRAEDGAHLHSTG